jgi:hypothetical protein
VVPNITPLIIGQHGTGHRADPTKLDPRLRALVEDSLRPHLMAVPGIAVINVSAARCGNGAGRYAAAAQTGLRSPICHGPAAPLASRGLHRGRQQRIALTMELPMPSWARRPLR